MLRVAFSLLILLALGGDLRADSVDITVNGKTWGPLEPIADYGPIYTAKMPGETFEQRLKAAYELAKTWKGQTLVVWEPSWQEISNTIDRPSIDGLRDMSTGCKLHWSDSVPDTYNKPMIRMRAGYRIRFEGIYLKGRRISTQEDIAGDAAIELVPDYESNRNTARNIVLELNRFDNFDRGIIIGGFDAPDVTGVTIRDNSFGDCVTGIEACGGNVIVKIDNNDFTGRKMQTAIRTIYSTNRHFDGVTKPQYVDAWGKHLAWDWCKTNRWKERLIDSARNKGTHAEFDPTTARTTGGGADLVVTDNDISFGPNPDLKDRWAVLSEGASFELIRTRIEGWGGAAKINAIYGNPNLHNKRFDCLIQDVHVVKPTTPIFVERKSHNAGFPLRIVRGFFEKPELPAESNDPKKGIVIWDKPRGPEGVIQ